MTLPIPEMIRRLADPPRGKGRAGEAPAREALPAAKSEAVPDGTSAALGGGVSWPLTEQAYNGAGYYSITSSDGCFVLEFEAESEYLDDDGSLGKIIHRAP